MNKKVVINGHIKFFLSLLFGIIICFIFMYSISTLYYKKTVVYKRKQISNKQAELKASNTSVSDLQVLASEKFLDKIYPLGSIYISDTLSSVSDVQDAIGGKWEVYGAGRTLVGVDTSDKNYNTVEKTGGSATQSYKPSGTNSGMAVTMNEVAELSHSGMAVTMNEVAELAHSGGGISALALSVQQLPVISGSITMHNAASSTPVNAVSGVFTSGLTNASTYTKVSNYGASGAPSYSRINFSVGSGATHTHTYTQLSKHAAFTPTAKSYTNPIAHKAFTPSVKSYTNPTFTGNTATISNVQPYTSVYMYKRVG